jgi:hypothetical protein
VTTFPFDFDDVVTVFSVAIFIIFRSLFRIVRFVEDIPDIGMEIDIFTVVCRGVDLEIAFDPLRPFRLDGTREAKREHERVITVEPVVRLQCSDDVFLDLFGGFGAETGFRQPEIAGRVAAVVGSAAFHLLPVAFGELQGVEAVVDEGFVVGDDEGGSSGLLVPA